MKIFDISLPFHANTPCWPGKKGLTLETTRSLSRGDPCTSHTFGMDIHLGTHLDAPAHFVIDGITVDRVPLAAVAGPCDVIECSSAPGSEIPAQVIRGHLSERVLFKTQNSGWLSRPDFDPRFVALSEALAHQLVQDRVSLVGIDYFSVDRFESTNRTVHHILLEAGVVILEGINLSDIEPGRYQLFALPLNIVGAEGSPVRAVLIK